jgi:outer membrane protein assembly factor BamB
MIPTGDGLALVTYRAGGGRDGALRVVARDLDDGTVRWSVGAEDGDFASLVGEDQVVVLSRRGPRHSDVAFHDARDGSEQWTAEGTLIAVGERLVYLLREDALVAVELATGDERWSRDAGLYDALAELRGAEVGDTLLVGRSSRTVAGLSTADGTFRWSRSFEHPLWAMRAGGEVALVFSDDATSGIDPADGAVRWTEDDRGWQAASLLRFEGQDSLHALGDRVTRLDPATGARLARSPAPDPDRSMIANTAVADGVIYTAGDDEVLWALEPGSLERRWSIDVGAEIREVVAADGTVVVVTPGELVAYRG